MTINFHNNNQYNPWMQLAQQGLNMFCGNSMNMFGMNGSLFNYGGMGFGSLGFGGMGFGGITGYNNVNYDAMAGWAVGNALLGVANQAIGSIKADRQNDDATYADNKAQIESIDKQIADLKAERENLQKDPHFNTDVKNANKAFADAEQKVLELQGELNALKAKKGEDRSQADIDAKQNELDDAIVAEKKAKTDKENAEKAKAKIDEIEEKIKGLEAQRARLQAQVDDADLDKADGRRLQRLSDDDYAQCFNNDGSLKSSVTYTKKHARTAINHFMNAVDPDKKLKAAKNLVTMYNQYLSSDDKTTLIRNAATIAQRYIDEHKQK